MNVAIIGSRDWPYASLVVDEVLKLDKHDTVVSGGAHGVDTFAENAAKRIGLKTIIHEAKWDEYGKSAGMIRNHYIVEDANRMIAFSFENSRGTQHTIGLAKKRGIPVKLVSFTKAHGLQVNEL